MNGHRRARAVLGVAIGAAVTMVSPTAPKVEAAAFVVNDTRDRVDSRPGNGVCRTSSGTCTLRAAIQEANSRDGADVITLRAGTYMITRAPLNENDITTGDLDITAPLMINGIGSGVTIVDGGTPPAGSPPERTGLDRLFEIHPSAGNVTLSGLTIREGWEPKEGGAISTRTPGTVRLVGVDVLGSVAGTAGGGLYYDGFTGGSLVLERSTVAGNTATGEGGGIYVASGRLSVTGTSAARSTVAGNTARNGGGLYNAGGPSQAGAPSRVEVSFTVVSGNTALEEGGGIDNRLEGELSLIDVTVVGNAAGGDGGGVASVFKTSLAATRTSFTANSADASGAGVFTHTEGSVTIDASDFSGNAAGSAGADSSADGGGLSLHGSGTVDVAESTFSANTASGEGGGIAIHSDGPVDISDTVVSGNTSAASGGGILASGRVVNLTRLTVTGNTAIGEGGGIDNQGSGEFAIVDTTIASNTASDGGGFANRADSTLRVSGSTFSGNHAALTGGGFLHGSDAATDIENSTLSGNHAGVNGGGLYLDADAGLHVANTTITRNAAPFGSGVGTPDAIDNFPVASHPLLVFRNTIVAGNLGGPDCHASFGSEGGNLDGGTLCNFNGPRDRTNVNPGLSDLADNGGPTMTHALIAAPAVGGGVEPCPASDQRGMPREADLPCDIGAYEFAGTPEASPPDATHPQTTLDSGPADTTENTDAMFGFSADEQGASFECALDGAAFVACVAPVEYTDLGGGVHTFVVRAIDAAGNSDPTPASFTWTIELPPDATPPATTIDSAPPVTTASRDAVFVVSSSEAGATFECSLDGVSFEACVSPAGYAGLTAGVHTFAVRASDPAGNQDPTPANHMWTVVPPLDLTGPETTIDSGPAATSESPDATFVFSANEPGSTFTCALDGPSYNVCNAPVELAGLSVGTHTFQVLATDPAGNVEHQTASHTWTIVVPPDTTPPETTLASGPASPTEETSALFTFSASESGATFECALDGEPFGECASPRQYVGLRVSDHTFEVRALDLAGNVDLTPETYTWTIEAPPPPAPPLVVTIGSGPASPTEDAAARFTFSASVPGARFECALDGAAFSACGSPVQYSSLAVGDHTFEVRALDRAGNVDSELYAWTVDAPPTCGAPVSMVANADAWIDENSASTSKGDDSILKVQSKAPRDNFHALVRFPIPLALPVGCRIESATLSLYAASSTSDRTLEVVRIAEHWSEGSVSWNDQPQTIGNAAVTPSGSGYRDWAVTQLVQAMYDDGTNHGFVIRDEEGGGAGFEQQFHSREKGETPPTLVITLTPAHS